MEKEYKALTDEVTEIIIKESNVKSIRKMAQESGVSHSTISKWINKKAVPTIDNAQYVLQTIGYDLKVQLKEEAFNE